jgi:MvaI/BcnI restriction endonuclease family
MLVEIDLRSELDRICRMGYIPAVRAGDSAIGDTLEQLLGLKPTNHPGVADLLYDGVPTELKARRKGSSSQTTLFSCRPSSQKVSIRQLVHSFGQRTAEHVKALFIEVSTKNGNGLGFHLRVDVASRQVELLDSQGDVLWTWAERDLAKKISSQLVIVEARERHNRETEEFRYESAMLYRDLRPGSFLGLVKNGDVVINIRARFKRDFSDWKNHGTVFRSQRSNALASCYLHVARLL